MARTIDWRLRVDWDFNGVYTDESTYLMTAAGSMRLAAPETSISSPRGIVDECTLTLDNADGRFSAQNGSGPLYPAIQGGGAYHAPMYLEVSIDGGSAFTRVFTGVVKVPQEATLTPREGASVRLDCRSRDELLLTKRLSTPLNAFVVAYDNFYTEADHMRAWLVMAGLEETVDFVLDPGLFVIPWAWLDDESPLEEIWQLAAACGGRFYCDPDGIFRYENASHWLNAPHTDSQEGLDRGTFSEYTPHYEDRELYNAVTVEIAARDLGISGVIWQADQLHVVPANRMRTFWAKLRQPMMALNEITYHAVTGGGKDLDSSILITTAAYAARAELTIQNSHATHDANLVTLTLIGIPVDGRPGGERTEESDDPFWDNRQGRTRAVRGNAYIQDRRQAAMLARFLRDRYQAPRLFHRLMGVPGNPARRLGDRVTVSDASTMTVAREAFLIEIGWRLDNAGFVQDLLAVDAAEFFPYSDYFALNSSLLGGADVVFY
jgi:hypothetical protein